MSAVEEPPTLSSVALDLPAKPGKVPRRILHFSDGVLEEYSTDEEEEVVKPAAPPVDPKSLTWFPWMWYYLVGMSSSTFYVADKCGEKLAWFFGITSPKYQHAIDEYYRLKAEEEEDAQREKDEITVVSLVQPSSAGGATSANENTAITGVSVTQPITPYDTSYTQYDPITDIVTKHVPLSQAQRSPDYSVPLEKY